MPRCFIFPTHIKLKNMMSRGITELDQSYQQEYESEGVHCLFISIPFRISNEHLLFYNSMKIT